MYLKDVLPFFDGSMFDLAMWLGIREQNCYTWKNSNGGLIPEKHALKLHVYADFPLVIDRSLYDKK